MPSNEILVAVIVALTALLTTQALRDRASAGKSNAVTADQAFILAVAERGVATAAKVDDLKDSFKVREDTLLDQLASVTELLTAANEKIDEQGKLLKQAYAEITGLNKQVATLIIQKDAAVKKAEDK